MLSLHTNNAALSAQNAITRNQSALSTSMTRLSTGYRINSAMDDAAGLQIATRLKAQSSGMAVAMRNTQNATSMMQTAEGALSEASNILVRMKDLATQAADASSNAADKTAMQSEYDALASELTNIIGNTSFGGAKLLNSKATAADVDAAAAKSTAAAAAKVNADLMLGSSTPGATAADAPTGTGAAQAYMLAVHNYNNAANDADKLAAYEPMRTAKIAFDKATEASAKADTAATSAANYLVSVTASQAAVGGAGKFSDKMTFQIGASSSETMELDLKDQMTGMQSALVAVSARYNSFGVANTTPGSELTTDGSANLAVDSLQAAIDSLGAVRSSLGATANRLEHASTNLANVSANTQAAAGRIMDVDFATESADMTSNQMLLQAGTAMLKQSNSLSSMVMSLLQ
ncbi:flagellin [Massilia sp. YIM B02443]|uniref:flagellin N-terminal helical domain-containing protein n=1 Tax=Massilia sp. YIM B02443 TaxID=3050127 RepID=UPI0025B6CF69|nr:flagellin [Massilia sp. YIM B02443]MDN4035957.1 flagellin [Massilia sp. YIM B02443]